MVLQLYNTRTRKKEPFKPLAPPAVGLYTCGPTVYNYAHIGNLRTYVFEDVLKRALAWCGYKPKHVMNITDVGHLTSDADTGEDKMELGARREGKSAQEIAGFYTAAFRLDMKRLNILEPDEWCRATDHIKEMVDLVRKLEANGHTYAIADGVYFDISTFPRYVEFARLELDKQEAGARVEVVAGKRHPADFALWKLTPSGVQRQMEWDSPWGRGFPGWHLECSAMSMKYLGEQFDIHCGGIDHIRVHHTNEIAQTEGATGKHPWVRFWLHGEFLVLDKEKMAKSGEGFITLGTVVERSIDPLAYRYMCLGAHYRQQLTFSWEALDGAAGSLQTLRRRARELAEQASPSPQGEREPFTARFRAAVEDDLNMPRALAVAWEVARSSELSPAAASALLRDFDRVLGLDLGEPLAGEGAALEEEIQQKINEREAARRKKDFATADRIRDELAAEGIRLMDTPGGVKWERRRK